MEHESHSLLIMHGSACQLNKSGERGSSSHLNLLGDTAPLTPPIASVLFILILIILRCCGVGRVVNPLPHLSHYFVQILEPGGAMRYKTGQELTLVNNCFPHRSCSPSIFYHTG